MLGSKKHSMLAGVMVAGMTAAALWWAIGSQPEPATAPATVITLEEESSDAALSKRAEQAPAVNPADIPVAEPSADDTTETEQEQAATESHTSQEIKEALDDLDLGGWDDSELSDAELGLPRQ